MDNREFMQRLATCLATLENLADMPLEYANDKRVEARKLVGEAQVRLWKREEPTMFNPECREFCEIFTPEPDEWHSMETAPRDGTVIQLYLPEPSCGPPRVVAAFYNKDTMYEWWFLDPEPGEPEHRQIDCDSEMNGMKWKPLSTAPESDNAQ